MEGDVRGNWRFAVLERWRRGGALDLIRRCLIGRVNDWPRITGNYNSPSHPFLFLRVSFFFFRFLSNFLSEFLFFPSSKFQDRLQPYCRFLFPSHFVWLPQGGACVCLQAELRDEGSRKFPLIRSPSPLASSSRFFLFHHCRLLDLFTVSPAPLACAISAHKAGIG